MADIDTVLERLVNDADFRAQLGSDPAAALAGYDLDADDLALLASSLDEGDQGGRGVEQRTSKSALVGLLASFAGGGGTGATGDGDAAGDGPQSRPGSDYVFRQRFEAGQPDGDDLAATADRGDPDPTAYKQGWPRKWEGTSAAGGDTAEDLAAPPDSGDDAGKVPGGKKYTDIQLKRGADTVDPGDAAPELTDAGSGGADPTAFKQGWPTKYGGGSAASDTPDELAAPDDAGEDGHRVPGMYKAGEITLTPGAAGDADPGTVAPDLAEASPGDPGATVFKREFPAESQDGAAPGDDPADAGTEVRRYDVTGAFPKKDAPPDDFLAIEDE